MASRTLTPTLQQTDLQAVSPLDGTKAYAQLRQTIIANGILDRSYHYYGIISAFVIAGLLVCLYAIYVSTRLIDVVVWSVLFIFLATQTAGLIHDAGHRAIFKSTKWNDLFGYIWCGVAAMGFDYWKTKHNMHHAHTNQVDEDPDLDIPLLSFTEEQLQEKSKLVRFICRYQAYLYYPMGTLTLFYERFAALKFFLKNPKYVGYFILFLAGIYFWLILPFILFPFTKAFIVVAIANLGIGFYFLQIFAPNHKGMPQVARKVRISFLQHQVMTSRNIRGNWWTDFLYMGLNYQIEHHLFPDCPRNKLKLITPHLLEICRQLNLEYTQVGILDTNKIIVSELNAIGQEARQLR